MLFKSTFRILFLLSICVGIQVTMPGCDKDGDKVDTSSIGTVYTPSNDYRVVAVIAGFGFFGCAQVTVADAAGEMVANAEVEVNDQILVFNTDFGTYGDDDGNLDYDTGEIYNLTVTVGNEIIAEGMARMPTIPEISSPADSGNHQLNQGLTVQINDIKYADGIYLTVDPPWSDADGNYIGSDTTYTYTIPSGSRSIAVPASVFSNTGWYDLTVEAVSGVVGNFADIDPETGDMGYNIQGPKGLFVAEGVGGQKSIFIPSSSSSPANFTNLQKARSEDRLARWKRQWRSRLNR